jgi:hypothetical protein
LRRQRLLSRFPKTFYPHFSLDTVAVLFASRYTAALSEAAAMLMISTLALAITVSAILSIGRGSVGDQ